MSLYLHREHQVRVSLPEWAKDAPGTVDLDEGIVDLIQALWQRNFATVQCCEGGGHRGNAWITFVDEATARAFVRIATGTDQPPQGWTIGKPMNGADTSVSFPPEAIPTVTATLSR